MVVCALAGAWAAPRIVGPASYDTDVATLRLQLAVSPPSERGVSLFVPIADWGLRAPVVGAPVKVSVEPRAIDRDGVARAVTGSGAAEIALLRQDLDRALRQLLVRTLLIMLAGALAGGLLARWCGTRSACAGRRLLLAPAAAVGLVAVVLGALGRWARDHVGSGPPGAPRLLRLGRRARAHPRPVARAARRRHEVLRAGELVDPLDRGPARRPLRRRRAAARRRRRPPPSASCSPPTSTTTCSRCPPCAGSPAGHLTILDGDFTINGGKHGGAAAQERGRRSATRSSPSPATTTRPASCGRWSGAGSRCSTTTTASGRSPG